ncbi:hypothetical protein DSO57_1039660 [Entomophthora muscae]|uniref:Uncharacterized protein n=1 Tax=Entomophthora muscae TaxID=34485 RepID=A0ACC2TUZ6_9FUNG|nr:hypothetical protein DSO57_1039660 [Entomophthora muscae]
MHIPMCCVVHGDLLQAFDQCLIESFCESIALRIICCVKFVLCVYHSTKLIHLLILKVISLVAKEYSRQTVDNEDIFVQELCGVLCIVFLHGFSNRPFGEILCGYNHVFLPTNSFSYRSHVVDTPHFEESTDCNWVDWFGYQELLGEHLTRIAFL